MSWQIHILNFKSISQKTAEKSLENLILAKGNNSCKSRSSVTKVKLDLYHVMSNSYTKFQVNISKDSREKSGKLKCDGRTDRQSPRQAGRGLKTNWLWNGKGPSVLHPHQVSPISIKQFWSWNVSILYISVAHSPYKTKIDIWLIFKYHPALSHI